MERKQPLLLWSVLLTTPWTTMYEGLSAFVEARRKQSTDGVWDGEVPPNYKTNTNPPLSLGRWVNRQRAAQAKGQLKEDLVQKLEMLGLKWFEEGEGEEFLSEGKTMEILWMEQFPNQMLLLPEQPGAPAQIPLPDKPDLKFLNLTQRD